MNDNSSASVDLNELSHDLGIENLTPELDMKMRTVTSAYVSDVLSNVLVFARPGGLLVTSLSHMTVLAVAVRARQTAVVCAGRQKPREAVIRRAVAENIPLLLCPSAFDVCGKLYAMGLRESLGTGGE